MKHRSTSDLFEYWNQRRGSHLAPERRDIEPGAIRHVLGDTFIVAFDPAAGHPLRLAGTRICALFCRELKGTALTALWAPASRQAIADLVEVVADESVGLVAGVTGTTGEAVPVELELLLLPLRHRGRSHARMIGTLAPVRQPYWLGETPVADLTLGTLRHVGPAAEGGAVPHLIAGGRGRYWRHGWMVYDGGRT